MKLWIDGNSADSIGRAIKMKVSEVTAEVNYKVKSRGTRAVNAMRNAELRVLKGQRHGKVYKKPDTHGRASKTTRTLMKDYGHKLRGGQLYKASAPGEPPARRMGDLRLHWSGDVETRATSKGTEVLAVLESQEPYAGILENGSAKMARRPFVEKIKEEAMPEIKKIYSEPYT